MAITSPAPLGQGLQQLIDTKCLPTRGQMVGISVSYLHFLSPLQGERFHSQRMENQSSELLIPLKNKFIRVSICYIFFWSFWGPGGLPEPPGFLPKYAKVLSDKRRPLRHQNNYTSNSGPKCRSSATCSHRDLVSCHHEGNTA